MVNEGVSELLTALEESVAGLQVASEHHNLDEFLAWTRTALDQIVQLKSLTRGLSDMDREMSSSIWMTEAFLRDLDKLDSSSTTIDWEDNGAAISFINTGVSSLREVVNGN